MSEPWKERYKEKLRETGFDPDYYTESEFLDDEQSKYDQARRLVR